MSRLLPEHGPGHHGRNSPFKRGWRNNPHSWNTWHGRMGEKLPPLPWGRCHTSSSNSRQCFFYPVHTIQDAVVNTKSLIDSTNIQEDIPMLLPRRIRQNNGDSDAQCPSSQRACRCFSKLWVGLTYTGHSTSNTCSWTWMQWTWSIYMENHILFSFSTYSTWLYSLHKVASS